MHGQPENIVQQAMVDDDTEEGSGGELRIDRAKGSIFDPPADVCFQQVVKHAVLPPEKHIGQLVAFQGAEEQQSEQRRVRSFSDSRTGQQSEQPGIVVVPRGFFRGLPQPCIVRFIFKNGGIERTFGGKMFEEERFTHTGCLRDFLRRRPLETIVGEQGGCGTDQVGLTLKT